MSYVVILFFNEIRFIVICYLLHIGEGIIILYRKQRESGDYSTVICLSHLCKEIAFGDVIAIYELIYMYIL